MLTTAYVDRLRAVAARVDAGADGIAGLPTRTDESVSTLIRAGKELEASAAAARDMLHTHRDATTRYGTDEEWRTVSAADSLHGDRVVHRCQRGRTVVFRDRSLHVVTGTSTGEGFSFTGGTGRFTNAQGGGSTAFMFDEKGEIVGLNQTGMISYEASDRSSRW